MKDKPKNNLILYRLVEMWHKHNHTKLATARYHKNKWDKREEKWALRVNSTANILSVWGRDVREIRFGPSENTSRITCGGMKQWRS